MLMSSPRGLVIASAIICAGASVLSAHPQTLDAAAKKAAEERKAKADASKVYTNADLKPVADARRQSSTPSPTQTLRRRRP